MALIVWLQALEPHALWHLGFAMLSWCGDGPLYVLLFPLLYWRKAPEEPPAPMQEPPALMEEVQEPDALVATNGHEQGEPVVAPAAAGITAITGRAPADPPAELILLRSHTNGHPNGVPGHTGTSCDPVCPQCHRHACESFAGTGRVCTQCGYCERPLSR